jgi:hypothetical protein
VIVAGGIALFAQGRAQAFKFRVDDQVHNALCAPENEGRPMGLMTITDPTALHSSTRSIVSKATQWTIDALAPLREHLSAWPAVLPSKVGDPIRPLKIGVHSDLTALLLLLCHKFLTGDRDAARLKCCC